MCAETTDEGGTPAAIMEATYRALCEYGYADLTIQAIADEFDKSKSLLYYHYDTKDEILLTLLEYLLEQYTLDDIIDTSRPADEQIESFVDGLLPERLDDDDREFQRALLELRLQGLTGERYRKQFTRFDRMIRETVVDILEDGMETGVFRDADVESNAELLVSLVNGVMMRRATSEGDGGVEQARRAIQRHIESQLLAEQST